MGHRRAAGEPEVFAHGDPHPNPGHQMGHQWLGTGPEPALFVKHSIVGEQAFPVATQDQPVGTHSGRVDQVPVGISVHKTDHCHAGSGGAGDPVEHRPILRHEGGPTEQVFRWIAGHRQLRKHGQIGASHFCSGQGGEDPLGIPFEVADHGVDLAGGQPQSGHRLRLPAPSKTLAGAAGEAGWGTAAPVGQRITCHRLSGPTDRVGSIGPVGGGCMIVHPPFTIGKRRRNDAL